MLTETQLRALANTLQNEQVLSVYVDGTIEDPAEQQAWRTQLEHSLKDLRAWLADSTHEERERFDRCVALLYEQLPPLPKAIGAPGWIGFVTSDQMVHAERLPVPVPTLAVWSTGISLAPYIRALKETHQIAVIVADARKAVVYRYSERTLHKAKTIHAHAVVEPPLHMGEAPRMGFHPGVHGATGHDEMQRAHQEGTAHMLKEVADYIAHRTALDAGILIGGIPEVAKHLARLLDHANQDRVLTLESLDVHSSKAEIAEAARHGASALRDTADQHRIAEIIEANGNGFATLGPAATREALDQLQVRELYFTHHYLENYTAEVERAVRTALAQGAAIEEVSRGAADQLNAHGGMAARLRYRRAAVEMATEQIA